jgi:DNA-binding LacI/PurR family transcriptional regulator
MSQAELAKMAFHALLNDVQMETPNPNGTEYVLQTNLLLRETTALNQKRELGVRGTPIELSRGS